MKEQWKRFGSKNRVIVCGLVLFAVSSLFACQPGERWIPTYVSKMVEGKLAGDRETFMRYRSKLEASGKAAVPFLIELFSHPDPSLQTDVIFILISIGKSATPQLIQALNSKNEDTIFNSLRTLEMLKDHSSVSSIRPFTDNPNDRISFQAARALANIDDPVGLNFFRTRLQSPSAEIRTRALNHIAEIRAEKLLDEVMPLIRDPDAFVKLTAIDTMIAINSERAVTGLRQYGLHDSSWKIRQRSAFAIFKITNVGTKYVNEEGKEVFARRY